MNIQDWFPLGLTVWIALLSKGLSRVFSNTAVQKHQFFGPQPSLWSKSHINIWLLEKPYLWLEGPLTISQHKYCYCTARFKPIATPTNSLLGTFACFVHCCLICNHTDYSPPVSFTHGILQTGILEWGWSLFPTKKKWEQTGFYSQEPHKVLPLSLGVQVYRLVAKSQMLGPSLVVQWLRLCASTKGGMVSTPGQGTKILHIT